MIYRLKFETLAEKELIEIKKSDKVSYNKAVKLLSELIEHPKTGAGNPEQLKHELSGKWSRRINKKDRLIYSIDDNEKSVKIYSFKGHYK